MHTIALLGLIGSASAATWPDGDAWQVATFGGDALIDDCDDGDGSATFDIVGTTDNPAAYWADDGSTLWFRMRLAAEPVTYAGSSLHKWRSFYWGVLIESDWDDSDEHYDWMLVLDGAEEQVQLWRNDTGGSDPSVDSPDELVATWDAPVAEAESSGAGYAGFAQPGSDVCDGTASAVDVFLDFGAPLDELADAMGVDDSSELSFMFGTSTSGSTLGRDTANCDELSEACDQWWGAISDNEDDADEDRLSSSDEVNFHDTDPLDYDSDEGGAGDGDEVLDCDTDPLDPDDDPDCIGGGDGGSTDGGTGDGGTGDGGTGDGGTGDGGTGDGGTGDGGTGDGGTGDGGTGDGGTGDGGTGDGGSGDGGSGDGGSGDGGSTDGGSNDGGSTDGGSTDGGSNDGGSTLDPSVDPEAEPPEGGIVRGGCGCAGVGTAPQGFGLVSLFGLLALARRRQT